MSLTFGLDIGTTSIKALSLKKSGSGFAVESMGIGPAPEKSIMSESDSDLQQLILAVKKVIDSSGTKQKEVNIALPEAQVFTKIIEMPQLSEKELAAALKYELEQYIPLPLDQVKTDWQILGSSNNQPTKATRILLVAAPLTLIRRYESLVDRLGLISSTIETEMLAVQRALMPVVNSPAYNMVVHMGGTSTDIAVMQNGEITMVFSVDKGGNAITRAISLDLGIDLKQAEEYKKAYGLSKDAFEGKIGKSLFPILESIVGDIRKTILLFREKNPEGQISQIILSGGAAQLPGIDIYFTNQLGLQVVQGNVFQIYGIKNVPPQIASDALSFNTAIGLSLKDLV